MGGALRRNGGRNMGEVERHLSRIEFWDIRQRIV
jgi:hypothetical protein